MFTPIIFGKKVKQFYFKSLVIFIIKYMHIV